MTELRSHGSGPRQVLSDIYAAGVVTMPSGRTVDAQANGMSQPEGEHLYRLVLRERPVKTLEVGMAFGLSTLFICQAMIDCEGDHHIVIDPNQSGEYEDVGLRHVSAAGCRDLVTLLTEPSQTALPRLVANGTTVDFAFIDGQHLFDYVLLDFFFVDQMLPVGGVIALHDANLPSVAKAIRFATSNRSYVEETRVAPTGTARRLARRGRRGLRGTRALRDAVAFAFGGEEREVVGVEFGWPREFGTAILRKTQDDERHWSHFASF